MAKTLVDLDRDLVERARQALGEPTMAAAIREALRIVVANHAHRAFMREMAELDDEQRAALDTVRDTGW